jgi:hypothetical protein
MDRDIMVLRQSNGRSYLPEPTKEHRFAPGRRYAFDRCWIDSRIAIEVEGGIWMQTSTGRSKRACTPETI